MEEAKRSTEKNYKNNQNKRHKMAISTNTFKCQWNKCFNEKTQWGGGCGDWFKKKRPIYILLKRTKDIHKLKVRRSKKKFHANGNNKGSGSNIHIKTKQTLKQSP